MKLVKPGQSKFWVTRVTCDASGEVAHGIPLYSRAGCKAVLEITTSDILVATKQESSYQGPYDVVIYIVICPECNQWVEVTGIPPFVRQHIDKAAPGFELRKDSVNRLDKKLTPWD